MVCVCIINLSRKSKMKPLILVRATHKQCTGCSSDVSDYGHKYCYSCCEKDSVECMYFRNRLNRQRNILETYYPDIFEKLYK